MDALKIEKGMALNDLLVALAHTVVTFFIHLLVAIVVFYVGRFLIRRIYALIKKILTKREVDASITTFVLSGTEITLYFLLVIVVIGIMGIETSSFIALFASAGVAIGMALSGTLQNFAGGVLILLLRPYNVGDYIEAQGYAGTVREIRLFNTLITTFDNKTIIIPNGPLFTGSINNYSTQAIRRVDWSVSVAYGTDFDLAKQVLTEILAAQPDIIRNDPDHAVNIYLSELADSAVVITVRAWVPSDKYWGVFFAVNEQTYKLLPQRGIEFPFPQLDVHLQPQS